MLFLIDTRLSNLWGMQNSASKDFGPAMRTDSFRQFFQNINVENLSKKNKLCTYKRPWKASPFPIKLIQ